MKKEGKLRVINSKLDKLKPITKNETGVTLTLLTNIIGHADDVTNFPCKLPFDFL